MKKTLQVSATLLAAVSMAAGAVATDQTTVTAPVAPIAPSKPLRPVSTGPAPVLSGPLGGGFAGVGAASTRKPLDMKLLVVAADGLEPAYPAIRAFLETVGIPYDTIVAKTQALPVLANGTKGFYQGIVLTSGNLAIEVTPGNWASALSPESWTALDNYARDYSVRTVAMYAFPEARYGLSFLGTLSPTDVSPAWASIPAAGQPVFSYINTANPLKVIWAYTYLAAPAPAQGETTIPVINIGGQTAGALHTKADGREYLALTFDQSPYLIHSLALNYGLINWVTRGVFLGSRRVYLTPQNDDLFLPNDQFVSNIPGCQPLPSADLTYDPATNCPSLRITGADLDKLAAWQSGVRANPQTSNFRVTHAFNGFGATAAGGSSANDSLVLRAMALKGEFYWVSHTYDHEHLDCFNPVPNSGICTPATYAQSRDEINLNNNIAIALGISLDRTSMVTPAISGLANSEFLRAAADARIRYVVGDMSRPEHVPAVANTLIVNAVNPRISIIPRRATNIFYNATTPNTGANGSESDEYNFFFGPAGVFRLPDGSPFFTTTQTYAQVVDRESDALLSYMLRYELYPSMFHQGNFYFYDNQHALFTDVIDAALTKFKQVSNLPVSSLAQTTIGSTLQDRMTYLGAGVAGTYTPGVGITLTAQKTTYVPLTGACATGCASYGGQNQSRVLVRAGTTVSVVAP